MNQRPPPPVDEKQAALRDMFSRIARRYDIVNAMMTAGLDGHWRRRAAAIAGLPEGGLALDIGTGTGDMALELARSAPGAHVVGLDYTAPMLAKAPHKAVARGVDGQVSWLRSDGHRLPFPDDTFDVVASAFVLRNLVDLDAALREMSRVLHTDGRVVALEIAPGRGGRTGAVLRWYLDSVVPRLGAIVSGDRAAYRYLPDSVAAFLDTAALSEAMRRAGLVPLRPSTLAFGALAVHVGAKRRPGARL